MIRLLLTLAILIPTCSLSQDSDCKNENCLETLHFDSVLVNGIPLLLATEELEMKLGQPDSIIIENDWECGNFIDGENSVEMRYYGKSKFMSSNGKSLLYVINFEDDIIKFKFLDNTIAKGTTKVELAKYFPNAMRMFESQVYSYHKKGRMKVRMRQTPDYGDSSGWMFTFNGNTIKEIRLWWFIC